MRFLVLGAGALGGYFGGMLLKGGADLSFLVRPKRAAQLAEQGLIVKSPGGDIKRPVKAMLSGEIDGYYDVVLLACKASDLDSATEAIAPALGEDSAVLPLLNGISHISMLVDRFGPHRVLGGATFVNALFSPDGPIIRRSLGPDQISFGELTGERSARCERIRTRVRGRWGSERGQRPYHRGDVGQMLRVCGRRRNCYVDPSTCGRGCRHVFLRRVRRLGIR